jgi:tRNA A-37 threonylcarbamoyl transferase component Bud32
MEPSKTEIRKAADKAIEERPKKRVLSFELSGNTYWAKRKASNGRNEWVKFSPEKEFFYEIARLSIAASLVPAHAPRVVLLTPDYMVMEDSGRTVKKFLDSDASEEEKEQILFKAGKALAELHEAGIIHGRPALRDMTVKDGDIVFLDWENRFYSKKKEEQRAIDFLLLLQGIYRERYSEEKERVAAAERGYLSVAGSEGRQEAEAYLKKHGIVTKIISALSAFPMKDVDAVRRLIQHFQ